MKTLSPVFTRHRRHHRRLGEPSSPPRVPSDVGIVGWLAEGGRAHVYEGRYQGRRVAVKVYKPAHIHKYRKRYKVNIAQFEHERNSAFYSIETLRRYSSVPLAWSSGENGCDAFFVQSFTDGESLYKFANDNGYLPDGIIKAGEFIVREAQRHGLHDLDFHIGNIMLTRDEQGWKPVVSDFNLMPQHLHPLNPFMALAFLLGLRDKSCRDYRSLQRWKDLAAEYKQ